LRLFVLAMLFGAAASARGDFVRAIYEVRFNQRELVGVN